MKSAEVRRRFLNYFRDRGHEIVPSSSLVPGNDPTLLFTNAGMVQFKDVFLGNDKRPYNRATTSQRCVRAGGKHNDLENVGYTARHHTFFEMLGNFSFGDYFKREAIHYAWDFITNDLGIPSERLWATVYCDDDEAADIWLNDIGIPKERFSRLGEKDNFWSMGDTGPCGPCTELFYDHGPDVPGGPPGSPDEDGDRYIEIWNLVFMQFDRDASGEMTPLPKPSVDTGMGLERIAAVMQGVHSNYEIDLFVNLIDAVAALAGTDSRESNSLRVIADHIRACAFLVVDGVLPNNEGRGYVLRRIIRRAIRHGHRLGIKEPFFYKLVAALDKEMGEAYPELSSQREHVERVLLQEEERFAETLDNGMKILDEAITGLDSDEIPGATAFKLYDTYGFPLDLTADIARERGLKVDTKGFDVEMEQQRQRAQASNRFGSDYGKNQDLGQTTRFDGYENLAADGTVTALLQGEELVEELKAGETGAVVLDTTPFYAESGGQVGDQGVLVAGDVTFRVSDTQKNGDAHVHLGALEGDGALRVGDTVTARVNAQTRTATVLNHSATHLLHAALRKVLGDHVTQKGSLVAPDRLRFDFSHYQPVSAEELNAIEAMVNDEVRGNADAQTRLMSFDDAVESGAMALFGEKYDDEVRVLKLGEFSTELCGGTHVRRVGDVGLFRITTETGIASGVRRIEAITGATALAWVKENEARFDRVAGIVKAGRDDAEDKVRQIVERNRALEKELAALKSKLVSGQGDDLAAKAIEVEGTKVLAARLDGADPKSLREAVDKLKDKLGSSVVVLTSVQGEKVSLVAGISKDRNPGMKAGELASMVAARVGGKGGGRPDMAQGGGSDPSAVDDALGAVADWVRERAAAG
ncbi:MAG: alanine--tRNA ligase [Pseudomonadota bacterium]